MGAEQERLRQADERESHWRRWGPYVAERAWGTVREDYSPYGTAWEYFPFEHSHLRAYRWNEDGLLGICDNHHRLCIAPVLWNGRDPILKERLYGLNGHQGNHSEDVKELYYYLDSTPTHSYMQALYKYPQAEFPYQRLLEENSRRTRDDPEFELIDTGIFDENRYWDVFVEVAKASVDDILIRYRVVNRGPDTATLSLMPTAYFRNTWSWGRSKQQKPRMWKAGENAVAMQDETLGRFLLQFDEPVSLLFTQNETNSGKLWENGNSTHCKDAFAQYLIGGNRGAAASDATGTKACGLLEITLGPGEERITGCRLCAAAGDSLLAVDAAAIFDLRRQEADEFYQSSITVQLSDDGCRVMRQANAGLLWSKQCYRYVVEEWQEGDPACPPPPPERLHGRNSSWTHLYNDDVISMPDKWEYPWYAGWDLAFHMIPMAVVDPGFAKSQLALFLREWYMHPNGQLPAYEWALGDVNPPVHAWACWRVYQIDRKAKGEADIPFLERCFHKLLMNFTWWVNRKDASGNNVFEGGFLGLDNIGIFDRSKPLPTGGTLEQSDATSWMAMYSLNMLTIALELAQVNRVYEDIASKFFEHFLHIATAMNQAGDEGLWNEEDGFYYDLLRLPSGEFFPMRLRSLVGLIPLFAVDTLEPDVIEKLPGFRRRMQWFLENRPDLCGNVASMTEPGVGERRLLSIVGPARLKRILASMLDESEFLSPHGVRSLSKWHKDHPFTMESGGEQHAVYYEPAESRSGLFGGNSNWRGPVWFPVNYLLIESLQRFHHYLGDDFVVEVPKGSGNFENLWDAGVHLSQRLSRLFTLDATGRRPSLGDSAKQQTDPEFRDHILFYEYFDGDTGRGMGASHQTGWTALVAKLLAQNGE